LATSKTSRCSNLAVESLHILDDRGQAVLDGEMTRIQPVHFRVGKILEIGLTAFAREEDVILSPEDDCLRLLLSQERLPLRIKLYVGAIAVKEIELNAPCIGPIKKMRPCSSCPG
jgi:hypothetical protein